LSDFVIATKIPEAVITAREERNAVKTKLDGDVKYFEWVSAKFVVATLVVLNSGTSETAAKESLDSQ
jgi:hypothetical protein